jgi:CRISPR/Cas system-associated exonuclease Cas4 (RecB family)
MLKELIDKFYLDQQKSKEQTRFYITDAGKCGRAIFFKFKNAPREKLEARLLRLYERGEYLHRNIISILIRMGILVASEVNIPAQEMIAGRADAIVSLNNELYLVDIKSINSMIFRNLDEPKEENVAQLQLYLHYFNIKKGILLYIDKDQQGIKEFFVNYDKNIVQSLLKNFESLKQKVDSNVVPGRLLDYPQNWQCQYCQFKETCALAGGEEIHWENFKKKIGQQSS